MEGKCLITTSSAWMVSKGTLGSRPERASCKACRLTQDIHLIATLNILSFPSPGSVTSNSTCNIGKGKTRQADDSFWFKTKSKRLLETENSPWQHYNPLKRTHKSSQWCKQQRLETYKPLIYIYFLKLAFPGMCFPASTAVRQHNILAVLFYQIQTGNTMACLQMFVIVILWRRWSEKQDLFVVFLLNQLHSWDRN